MEADKAREITILAARKIANDVVAKIYDLVESSAEACCSEVSVNIDKFISEYDTAKESRLDFRLVRQFINTTLTCDGYTSSYKDDNLVTIGWCDS